VTGSPVALDTSLAIAVINGRNGVPAWVASFAEVCLPSIVVGELLFGALNSGRATQNAAAVDGLVASCRVLPADLGTARTYASVRAQLKKAGTPIPENDVWIAAVCAQHSIPLATFDAHFQKVDGLKVVAP
jgi:tRNA(fMet)-specific endonuclease VapC